jgi:hypothetical protein
VLRVFLTMNRLQMQLLVCASLLSGIFLVFCTTVIRFPAGGIHMSGPWGFVIEAKFGEKPNLLSEGVSPKNECEPR